jgi:hypothetical protein
LDWYQGARAGRAARSAGDGRAGCTRRSPGCSRPARTARCAPRRGGCGCGPGRRRRPGGPRGSTPPPATCPRSVPPARREWPKRSVETAPGRSCRARPVTDQHHLHRAGGEHRRPQAGKAGDGGDAALAVAGHLVQRERGGLQASDGGQLRQPVALVRGRPCVPRRRGGASRCRRASARSRQVTVTCLGRSRSCRLSGVGAVYQQVDAALAEVATDQLDQLDGQVEPPGGVLGLPQPGQDRQTDRPVWDKRQVDQHAQHHPVVGPGDAVAPRCQRVVVPASPEDLAAAAGAWCQASSRRAPHSMPVTV